MNRDNEKTKQLLEDALTTLVEHRTAANDGKEAQGGPEGTKPQFLGTFRKHGGFAPLRDGPTSAKRLAYERGLDVACGCALPLNSHNHTFFSVVDGISSPEAMVDMTAMRGYGGFGISDHGSMGGNLRAGKAGKEWKTARSKKTGRLLNYREVELRPYLRKHQLCSEGWTSVGNQAHLVAVLAARPRCLVFHNPKNPKQFRVVDKRELESSQWPKPPKEVDLAEHTKLYSMCDNAGNEVDPAVIALALTQPQKVQVTHNPAQPKQFRILTKEDIEPFDDFKVVSGCELYCSWRRNKDKRYNHVTVYATDKKSHEALVQLCSIGSIPSRRYVGGHGFFRPRVFIEDIEVAARVAGGGLVVTTGCPISVTSEAFREGRDADAKEFFEWGKRVLGPGRFFAELHLCDVSLDFNPGYKLAEDRFHSTVLGVPVSRFRHETLGEAQAHAAKFHSELRTYVLGLGLARADGRAWERPSEADYYINPDNQETVDFAKAQMGESIGWLREARISDEATRLFSREELAKAREISKEVDSEVEAAIEAAMDDRAEHGETAGDQGQAADAAGDTDDTDDADLSGVPAGTEPGEALRAHTDGTQGAAKVEVKVTKPAKRKGKAKKKTKRKAARIDEDSVLLLELARRVVDAHEGLSARPVPEGEKSTLAMAALLSRFVLYVMASVGRDESKRLAHCNPLAIIQSMLAVPGRNGAALDEETVSAGDAAALLRCSESRSLWLDDVLGALVGRPGNLDRAALAGAVRGLVGLLRVSPGMIPAADLLAPRGGHEDTIENEWITPPSGNWMVTVNDKLVKMAKEFDVPLLMASDSHMTSPELKPVQDALIKRGERRNWHMARPYAIPRADLIGYLEDAGADWTTGLDYVKHPGNCALKMVEVGAISLEDIVEAFGSGSLLLDETKSVSSFKWDTAIPRIRYRDHKYYEEATALLESGALRQFLPVTPEPGSDICFSDASINISTAIVVVTFLKAIDDGLIPTEDKYVKRILSELYLEQEIPHEQLADFFIVLQHLIGIWRDAGLSVGPGRGSSGGMLTAMISGITFLDPLKKGFLEGRWMNRGRKKKKAHADIDIDVNNRQIAGLHMARVAKDSFDDSVLEKPLNELEQILFPELFFSSPAVTHQWVGGAVMEMEVKKEDATERYLKNLGLRAEMKELGTAAKGSAKTEGKTQDADDTTPEADDASLIEIDDNNGNIVWGSPFIRVGTYGSLKAKAAVKEAIRIADVTGFDDLPSFGAPPPAWTAANREKLVGLSDNDKNALFEEERFGYLSIADRTARRRVRLGDRLTKEMVLGAGMARLYQNELDYFMGAVYGETPSYWDNPRVPEGSQDAQKYFDSNPKVKDLVLDMLNIYKSMGVHAGGFCFGREVFERIPVRADKHGYVSMLEMKDIEAVGILKFDVLGLETLNHISLPLRQMVDELPYERMASWLPEPVYQKVRGGLSTDLMWRYIPTSTEAAATAMCRSRAMTFQIDTPVFGRELNKMDPARVIEIIKATGLNPDDLSNDRLLDLISDLLALFRPGPMKLNSHVDYIERLMGKPFKVIHPWLERFVTKTFGVVAFQEQVMAIYQNGAIALGENGAPLLDKAGSFILASEEETDEVRRAMGKKDVKALTEMRAKAKFNSGLAAQGVPESIALQIWDMIEPFAEYGFNASHSGHYAFLTCLTLFIKTAYMDNFFQEVMGSVKPEDAARFLAEISDITRAPSVLKSSERRWRVVDGRYYPGLQTIEGLKVKDIHRLIEVQEELREKYTGEPVTAELWFRLMGGMTESLAKALSRSGALRELGSPADVAKGYEDAMLRWLKPAARTGKATSAEAEAETNQETDASATDGDQSGQPATKTSKKRTKAATTAKASEALDDLMGDLVFDIRDTGQLHDTDVVEEEPEAEEEDEAGSQDASATEATGPTKGRKKSPRPLRLAKKEEEIRQVFLTKGYEVVQTQHGQNVLTVPSAVERVISSKIKGHGMRNLLDAIQERETKLAAAEKRPAWAHFNIKELKQLRTFGNQTLDPKMVYRTVGIVRNVMMAKNWKTGELEPKVIFLAEGEEISVKFSRELEKDQEKVAELVQMLKDEKMQSPFIFDVYVGQFEKDGGTITYFKLEGVEKVS